MTTIAPPPPPVTDPNKNPGIVPVWLQSGHYPTPAPLTVRQVQDRLSEQGFVEYTCDEGFIEYPWDTAAQRE